MDGGEGPTLPLTRPSCHATGRDKHFATLMNQVSSVELERAVLEGLPEQVAEAAAVGVPTPGGGPERLVLFVVLKQQAGGVGGCTAAVVAAAASTAIHAAQQQQGGSACTSSNGGSGGTSHTHDTAQQQQRALLQGCNEAIRQRLNPLFKVSACRVVPSLPRTASNKVMRRLLRDLELPRAKM